MPTADEIFLSYCRDDSAGWAHWLKLQLDHRLGVNAAFLDTTSIQPGTAWPGRLREALRAARMVLVIIGPRWLSAQGEHAQRRIDHPEDWVRQEVRVALGLDVPVVPVLVDGASMPHTLDDGIRARSTVRKQRHAVQGRLSELFVQRDKVYDLADQFARGQDLVHVLAELDKIGQSVCGPAWPPLPLPPQWWARRWVSRPAMARTPWAMAFSSAAKSGEWGAPLMPASGSATPR